MGDAEAADDGGGTALERRLVEAGVDPERAPAVAERFRRARYGDRPYRYLSDTVGSLPRGTVVVHVDDGPVGDGRTDTGRDDDERAVAGRSADGRTPNGRTTDGRTTDGHDAESRSRDDWSPDLLVRGFPAVPRTLVLDPGVRNYFAEDATVAVEEKLNGYNVRVVRVEDGPRGTSDTRESHGREPHGREPHLLAFTRGGYVCPFTTAKVAELDLDAFFEARPAAMLCGEMVGPENPYTTCAYPDVDSVAFRAFDVRDRTSGDPLPVRERRALLDALGLPQVPLLGYLAPEETDRLAAVIDDLDARGREGVVLKSLDGTRLLKYTTSSANRENLAYGFAYPFDYGRDFVFARLVREAFRAVEAGDDEAAIDDRAVAVGRAILHPLIDTVRAVERGEVVGEVHTVRAAPATVDALLDHFRDLGVEVRVESDETAAGERVVRFRKCYRSSTDTVRAYLDGQTFRE